MRYFNEWKIENVPRVTTSLPLVDAFGCCSYCSSLDMARRRCLIAINVSIVGISLILSMSSTAFAELGNVEFTTEGKTGDYSSWIPGFSRSRSKRVTLSSEESEKTETIKDRKTLKAQLQQVENQLAGSNADKELVPDIQNYFSKVKKSLTSFDQYLDNLDNQTSKNFFYEEAKSLPETLQDLLDSQITISENLTNWNIGTRVSEIVCLGQKFKNQVEYATKAMLAGLWVHAYYQRMRNPFDPVSLPFNTTIKADHLLKILVKEEYSCSIDGQKVEEQMLWIIRNGTIQDRQIIAERILRFLEDEYNTKKWIVVVLPSGNGIEYVQSGGFYTATTNGIVSLAISSANRTDAPVFYQLKTSLFDKIFKFPFQTKGSLEKPIWNAFGIFQYLNRFLTPLRAKNNQLSVDTLVVRTPCRSTEEEMKKSFVTLLNSANLDKVHLTNDGSCVSYLLVVVPVISYQLDNSSPLSTLNTDSPGSVCNSQDISSIKSDQQGSYLRNEVAQAYLSLNADSNVDTYTILDRKWENITRQRWRFVNGTLRSDNGKCLTAVDDGGGSNVLVKDCTSHQGQKWIRHGLQIVNGFNKCLAFKGKRDDEIMLVVQADCQHSPAFLWYDWDVDCEDAVMIPLTNMDNKSRPLRNEFSKRYLSLDENGVWVTIEPWSKRPEQYWRFVDNQLINNQNGKCFTSKSSTSFLVDNCTVRSTSQKWSYNRETHQIIDASGTNCLDIGNNENKVFNPAVYSSCKGDSQHHWSFVQKPSRMTAEEIDKLDMYHINYTRSWKDDMGVGDALLFLLLEDRHLHPTNWTKLALANIESIFKQPQDYINIRHLNAQLLKIESELANHFYLELIQYYLENDPLKVIDSIVKNDHLKALDSIVKNERKISEILSTMKTYLASPNNSVLSQDNFFKEADTLPFILNTLVDDLLGENSINSSKPNLLITLRNASKCKIGWLEWNVKSMLEHVTVGIWVHAQYQRMKYVSDINSLVFSPQSLNKRVLDKLAYEVSKCRKKQREADHTTNKTFLTEEKICSGTDVQMPMSKPSNLELHYRNLRNRYTNCTYVDGNLELIWLQDEQLDLSFLQDIRQVTGYVRISHVDVRRVVLPNLQIIHGKSWLTFDRHNNNYELFALVVSFSKMHSLEMPALRDILRGSSGFFNNYNLCHIKTINWEEIMTDWGSKIVYVNNSTEPEPDCLPCHASCEAGCWGEGPENCQKFSNINCSPQCKGRRCFGPKPEECCDSFCIGGCTGPKESECLACRSFKDDGVCKQECPAMKRYNPTTDSWENNPEGKYAYDDICVKTCPYHLLEDDGECVRRCFSFLYEMKAFNRECVLCDGQCPKTCWGANIVDAGNIEDFKDCTVLDGSITILGDSFTGFQEINPDSSFGPRYSGMHPDRLEIFSTLKEITEFIHIEASHPEFRNLSYFRNLEIVGGRQLTAYFSALYIVNTSLNVLHLSSLKTIHNGGVTVMENKELCVIDNISWNSSIIESKMPESFIQNNQVDDKCKLLSDCQLLRNEVAQGYLTVQGNSIAEGAYILFDRKWKNETGQRWTFVNNTLRNDNGKCLTAWNARSWYLYQYNCHPDWVGQNWTRNGLKIVNGFGYCLAIEKDKNEGIVYVIQNDCKSTPQFLWYDWAVDCEKEILPGKTVSQPLGSVWLKKKSGN